jgi:hypothetical protein
VVRGEIEASVPLIHRIAKEDTLTRWGGGEWRGAVVDVGITDAPEGGH